MASSSHLKPGQKGVLTARAETALKKGTVIETVSVLSNDPRRPKIVLTLQATVIDNDNPSPPPELFK